METIRELLEQTANNHPNRVALQLEDDRRTYEQLIAQITHVAHHLQAIGITSDKKVAFLFQSTPDSIIGFLALAWLHTGVIPLDPGISSAELKTIFHDNPFTYLLDCRPKTSQLAQAAAQIGSTYIDIAAFMVKPTAPMDTAGLATVASDTTFVYHYTSGSTGQPKAAKHPQRSLVVGASIYQQMYRLTADDVFLVPIPLYHSFGMIAGLMTALRCGSRLVLTERFIPNQVVKTIGTEKITFLLAAPILYDLLSRSSLRELPDMGNLRICLSSGSPLSIETAQRFQDRYGSAIYQVYGSTEAGVIAVQRPDDATQRTASIGRPAEGANVRIVDEQGQEVPVNETGRLLVQTATMFKGYYNHIDATTTAFCDGWYVTGDIAYQDQDGYLYIVGRIPTFINVGGKKVNVAEVEGVLREHELVKEAIVFGVDADSAGELVYAAVVLSAAVTVNELIAFCRQRLVFYKVPSHIEIVQELPQTDLGKIRRKDIITSIKSLRKHSSA